MTIEALYRKKYTSPQQEERQRLYQRAYQQERWQWMHSKSICPKCKTKDARTDAGMWLCSECAAKANELKRTRYKATREDKLQHRRDRRKQLQAAGICGYCGHEPLVPGRAMCRTCLDKYNARSKACHKRRSHNG